MPTKETATRPGIAQHQAAVDKLAALKAEEAQITDSISQEVVVGNDVGPLQARRVEVRASIETAAEAVKALRPHAAREEQTALRRESEAAVQTRLSNQERAREEQVHFDDLSRQLDETAKRVDYWKYRAHDGVFTANLKLSQHIAEHGDLSEGAQ